MRQLERINDVKKKNLDSLVKNHGAIGAGIGIKFVNGKPTTEIVLQVYVKKKDKAAPKPIPTSFTLDDGSVVKTDVIELGDVTFSGFTGRYRPAKPGAVLSNVGDAAGTNSGTFGALVTDNTDGQKVVLSTSHVMANYNNAQIGSMIIQPSTQYGGASPADDIATLKRFIPLNLTNGSTNTVDCAIAAPIQSNQVSQTSFCSPVKVTKQCAIGMIYASGSGATIVNPIGPIATALNITVPKTTQASLNQSVHFCSAYTGYVQTYVAAVNADIYVTYQGNILLWEDQILCPGGIASSANGDSGAVVYTTYNC